MIELDTKVNLENVVSKIVGSRWINEICSSYTLNLLLYGMMWTFYDLQQGNKFLKMSEHYPTINSETCMITQFLAAMTIHLL